jgi:hypothetical protein
MLPRVVLDRVYAVLSSYDPFRLGAVRRTQLASRLWFEVNRRFPFRDIRAAVDLAIQAGQARSIVDATAEGSVDPQRLPVDPRLGPGDPCYSYRAVLVHRAEDGSVVHTSAINVLSDQPLSRADILERAHLALRSGAGGTPVPPAVQQGTVPYSVSPSDSQVLQASRNASC